MPPSCAWHRCSGRHDLFLRLRTAPELSAARPWNRDARAHRPADRAGRRFLGRRSAECLTRALEFRDEYRDHPSIATAFAPLSPEELAMKPCRKIATLADELDAGIVMALHESHRGARSLARHGARPIERLQGWACSHPR